MSPAPVKQTEKVDYASAKVRARTGPSSGAILSLWLGVGFFIAMLAGFLILRLPGATTKGNELSVERALFAVINSATLTGFQQTTSLDLLGASGKITIVLLTIIGTLFSLIAGALAIVRIVGMNYTDRQVISGTLTWYILSVFAGTALLADPMHPILVAATQAISAFGNSGIVLGTLPAVSDWRTHVVLMGLATLGGLSIPVLLDLSGALFGRHRSTKHTTVVCAMMAAVYVIGVAACTPWQSIVPGNVESWTNALATGSALAIDTRTAGLPVASITSLTRVTQWILVVFMLVGAAPGSAAGGLKVTTIYSLATGAWKSARGEMVSRIFGVALIWLGIFAALVFLTFIGLLAFQPELPADRLLFIAVSGVGCVGLSQDPISMSGGGVIVLCAGMFLGRVLPIALLWWSVSRVGSAEVAVG